MDLELFRAFFDGTADALIVVDGAGEIVLANAACEMLLGHAAQSLTGRSVETIVPGRFRDHARLRHGFASAAVDRPMGRGLDLFAQHADGHEVPVDVSLTPLVAGGRRLVACALRRRLAGHESLRVQATALRSAANGVVITDRAVSSPGSTRRPAASRATRWRS